MAVFRVFWSVFFHIWTEIRSISSYTVRMWENTDQKNSEYEQFSLSSGMIATNCLRYLDNQYLSQRKKRILFKTFCFFAFHILSIALV